MLTQKGFVAILKQRPVTTMTAIKPQRISGEQPTHDSGNGNLAGAK